MPLAAVGFIAIDVFIIAFMALLLIYALTTFVRAVAYPVAALVDYLGGWIGITGDSIRNSADSIVNSVQGALSATWHAAGDVLDTIWHIIGNNIHTLIYGYLWVAEQLVAGLGWVATQAMGSAQGQVVNWVTNTTTQVLGWTDAELNALWNGLIGYTQESFTDLGQWTAEQITTAEQYTTQVANYAQTEATALTGEIASAEVAATNYTQQLYTQATGYAQSIVDAAVTSLNDQIKSDYDALANSIVQTQQWVQGQISAEQLARATAITAVYTVISTYVVPRIAAIEEKAQECYDPMCENLSDFGKGLQSIINMAVEGGLIAFFIEAATHPTQYARPIIEVADTFKGGAVDLFDSVAGTHF